MASRLPISAFNLVVDFQPREDGGLRATCTKIPGFLLSHSDPELVKADVGPALAVILSDMFGVAMEVAPLRELEDADQLSFPAHLCGSHHYVGLSVER